MFEESIPQVLEAFWTVSRIWLENDILLRLTSRRSGLWIGFVVDRGCWSCWTWLLWFYARVIGVDPLFEPQDRRIYSMSELDDRSLVISILLCKVGCHRRKVRSTFLNLSECRWYELLTTVRPVFTDAHVTSRVHVGRPPFWVGRVVGVLEVCSRVLVRR